MSMHWITCSAAAVTIAAFMSGAPANAAMAPALHPSDPALQRVDCAVGFHIGPAGGCVLGTEEPRERVIERRATDEDCATKTVRRTDDAGNSVTHTRTNCD